MDGSSYEDSADEKNAHGNEVKCEVNYKKNPQILRNYIETFVHEEIDSALVELPLTMLVSSLLI